MDVISRDPTAAYSCSQRIGKPYAPISMSIRLIDPPATGFDPHIGLVGNAGLKPSSLAVVDTSYIFDRAASRLRSVNPANVGTSGGLGSIRLFAPTRVAKELTWKIDSAARNLGVPRDALERVVWTDFVARTRFVELPPTDDLDDSRLKRLFEMDRSDLDLGRLGLMLAPAHIYSHDKHLRIAGFSLTIAELDAVVAAGLAVEVSDGTLITTGFGIRAGAAGVSGAVKGIAIRLEVPIWVVGLVAALIVAGGLWWSLSTPERRAKADDVLRTLAGTASTMAEHRVAGKDLLERTSLQVLSPSIENRVFRALALARGPLLTTEIQSILAVDGDAPSVGWIRAFLISHPAFVRVGPYRWQLGRQLASTRQSGP